MRTSKYTLNDTETERGPEGYRAIDGNLLKAPVAYCSYHHGYLTNKLIKTHKCHKKHGGTCVRFHTMEGVNIRQVNTQQYYDKHLDKLQKLEASLNRIVRSLDRIATALEQEPETPLDKAMRYSVPMPEAEAISGGIEAIPARPAKPAEAVEEEAEEWINIHR